jgi:hypothetical protein
VGQTRQKLTGRCGTVKGLRCTCCGQPLTGAVPLTAVLREVVYEYCGPDCRVRHVEAVALIPEGCELCDLDVVGDTGRCAEHLGGDEVSRAGGFPLAS